MVNQAITNSMKKRTRNRIILTIILTSLFVGWHIWKGPDHPTSGSGEAMIGEDFTLTNQEGVSVSSTGFRGRYMLVFFGFTNCPDICPTALQNITQAMVMLGPDAEKVVPVFITVDPERDTSQVIKEYVSSFHPSTVGLTGNEAKIREVLKSYKVYARKNTVGEADDTQDYMMDHSGYIYLMDKDGKYVTHFAHDALPADVAEKVKATIASQL